MSDGQRRARAIRTIESLIELSTSPIAIEARAAHDKAFELMELYSVRPEELTAGAWLEWRAISAMRFLNLSGHFTRRASSADGDRKRWQVSGCGSDVGAEAMIAFAEAKGFEGIAALPLLEEEYF
ncbi:hypothetical protein [Sphingomonas sp.]|uniref:hypothetical protein n=1 Tax=Sphingomonas sp. TaxID=28214 RepID=UPI000DB5293D|nr:hypothetical protein [Sphingomonas sp.]PZU10033.1 MAG: hypothetical protein DI605_05380 [Sphingomonas sp.]